jgi:hypothetical protein
VRPQVCGQLAGLGRTHLGLGERDGRAVVVKSKIASVAIT